MAMSRKNYIAVAAEFNSARKLALNDSEVRAIRDCAERMAQVFKADNSAFQTSRFMETCGF